MSWQQTKLLSPSNDDVKEVSEALSAILSQVTPVIDTAAAALEAARFFVTSPSENALVNVVLTLITELENFVNDLFQTNVHSLVVDPFRLFVHENAEQTQGYSLQAVRKTYDEVGIPLMSPSQCLTEMVSSFDDFGDTDRPQFSSSAHVGAFGLIVTAPGLNEFRTLLEALNELIDFEPFKRLLEHFDRRARVQVPDPQTPKPPDWDKSETIANFFGQYSHLRDRLIDLLGVLKGYVISSRDAVTDLIEILETKLQILRDLTEALNSIIDAFLAAAGAEGIYVYTFEGTGGNEAIKADLVTNDVLNSLGTKYTVGVLLVGGSASAKVFTLLKTMVS